MTAGTSRLRLADGLSWLAAALAALASAAGLLVSDLYRDAPYWIEQARGTDVATLFGAVPLLALGLWIARRGSAVGRLAVLGGLLYLVYNYAIFSFSVALNPLAVVYIALLGLSVWSLGLSLPVLESETIAAPVFERLPRRTVAGVLIVVAILFGLLWLSQVATATFTGVVPADMERAGLVTNPVYALDLGLFLPLCIVAAVGLLRGAAGAAPFALPILLWLGLTSAGIVAGFWYTANAGTDVPLPLFVLVGGIGLLTLGLAALVLRRRA